MVKHSVEHSERVGQQRLDSYLDALASALGHADREEPFRSYCIGLLLDGDRKSIEPMAARLDPERFQAKHQSLHHFVAQAVWSDAAVLEAVRRYVVPKIERHGPITAWIVDDTGIPKKGRHSVGVARQYCGQLGKQDNCQVAVTLSLANDRASLPVAWRLYLPEAWAEDPERHGRDSAGHRLPAADRPRPDPRGLCGGPAARPCPCRLRQRHRVSNRSHRPGPDLCCRHPSVDHRLGARHRTAAAKPLEWQGMAADAAAPG